MIKFAIISLFFSSIAFAQNINCTVSEFFEGQNLEQTLQVTANPQDSHGAMKFFKLKKFTQYEGFVALIKGFAVINVQTPDGSMMFTSHGNVVQGEFASLQLLFPSLDSHPVGILVQCGREQK